MTHTQRQILFLTLSFVMAGLEVRAAGSPIHLAVRACGGTMTVSAQDGFSRIIIDRPNVMSPPSGSCSLVDAGFSLAENPVLDFWIRVQGNHSVAFFLDFGTAGLAYAGYQGTAPHALNIVGTQAEMNYVTVTSLGDLGEVNDGTWHHIVFDLGYAIKAWLQQKPETIGKVRLRIGDGQSSVDIFAGAPAQPLPATIDLRDMVLRARQPNESYFNDLFLSVDSVPTGEPAQGGVKQLVGGSAISRRPLTGVEVVIEGDGKRIAAEPLGAFQDRKDFAFVVTAPATPAEVRAKLVSNGKVVTERQLRVLPPLSTLRNATIHIIPNSHNDIGWLDTPETTADWRRDKVIGPAIPLLEKYPDYRYGMETTLFLMEYLNRVPAQASTIDKLTAEGRLGWGATYNQPYQSLWRGESLVRELYYGRKWMREHLGPDVDCVTAWGTDVPSMAMQMPQILAKSGVKYFMFGRFKPGVFNWYSPDGSKVVVGSQGIYGRLAAYLTPYQPLSAAMKLPGLLRHWDDYYGKNNIPAHFAITDMTDYLPPTEELIPLVHKWEEEVKKKFGMGLNLRFATGEEFMKAITSNPAARFPDLTGEWPNVWAYIHGPTHHDVVSAGREAVWTLASAEKFWTLKSYASRGVEQYPRATFDQAWMAQTYTDHGFGGYNGDITDTVFLNKEREALLLGRTLLNSALEWIASHATPLDMQNPKLVMFNPLSWDRTGTAFVEIPTPPDQDAEIVDATGNKLTLQRVPQVPGGTVRYLVESPNIPAIGYSTLAVHFKPRPPQTPSQEEFKTKVQENRFYRLEFAPGGLRSIYDKELQKELLNPEGFLGGEVFMLDSVGNGAHEFGETQQPSWKNIEKLSQYAPAWRRIETGPVRSGWRLEQPMRQVTVRLDVYLYERFKRLDFDIQLLHWSGEKYKEFRMAMPVNIPDGQVAYEVPYGVLEVGKDEIDAIPFEGWYSRHARLIHPREVQDWVSVSSGIHSVMLSSSVAVWDYLDANEKKNRLTLLQPILLASRKSCHGLGNWYLQEGDHRYHFSLTSFSGDWRNNFRFGNEINCPLASVTVAPVALEPSLPPALSLCQVSVPNYVVSEIKVADDRKGILVRGYEVSGRDADVTLKLPFKIQQANPTSLIEENLPETFGASGGQVQFKAGQRSINAVRVIGEWNP